MSKKNPEIFHPTSGHEVSKGEQRYISTFFLTPALDVDWAVNATPRPERFTPRKFNRYPL
jgi:hypothetical protein